MAPDSIYVLFISHWVKLEQFDSYHAVAIEFINCLISLSLAKFSADTH